MIPGRYVLCIAFALAAVVFAVPENDTSTAHLRPLDVEILHSLYRISTPVVSPNFMQALYVTSRYDPETNRSFSMLTMLDTTNGTAVQLTPEMEGERISNPLWLSQDVAGYLLKGALYRHDLSPGTNGTLLYNTTTNINNAAYRIDATMLFFTADVFADGDIGRVSEHIEVEKKRADSAQVFDNLWARHWDKWMTSRKANLFTVTLNGTSTSNSQHPVREINLMQQLDAFEDPLLRWEVEGYAASSNGKHVAFVVRNPGLDMAWSTNVDIYIVSTDGNSKPKLLTGNFKGAAGGPAFSADGTALAWLQMETPGYEADARHIHIFNITTGDVREVAYDWELSPHFLVWSEDGNELYALAHEHAETRVFKIDIVSGARAKLGVPGCVSSIARLGGDRLLAVYSNTTQSADIYTINVADAQLPMQRLTDVNGDKLRDVYLGDTEDFWFTGARGDFVHGWMIRPYGFVATQKYPAALLMHGGPQQASAHAFSHGQWNPNMYASAGFVTIQVNFHGSPGYGQNFTDSVRQQWGGYAYDDLMAGLDYVIKNYDFVDSKRLVALGGSFGGYMANWINGNTDRFSALVSHDGQFDVVS
ncbi:Dipeptidyl-peptidase 5, partial [Coemansia guatemalensis]